mmetsp:Transcript_2152/g.4816  ORF Transcript_2152/g.4816 Transcript_2152/m.4816 type:complete len:239 (+) Transcript_2152:3-719(+)
MNNSKPAQSAWAAVCGAVHAIPWKFWAYAGGGSFMYGSVIPFWFYGSGFLQRSHGYTVAEADTLMVVPEGLLCVLSIPVGIVVDRFGFGLNVLQNAFAVCAVLIAASHAALAAGGNPVAAVMCLGFAYAVCNQLMWAVFPRYCPAHLMSLGAGIAACFINLSATIVPAVVGSVRVAPGVSAAEADVAMFSIFASLAMVSAAVIAALSWGVFERGGAKAGYTVVVEEEAKRMELEMDEV